MPFVNDPFFIGFSIGILGAIIVLIKSKFHMKDESYHDEERREFFWGGMLVLLICSFGMALSILD